MIDEIMTGFKRFRFQGFQRFQVFQMFQGILSGEGNLGG